MKPHSPTIQWLQSVAADGGYDADPDVGDAGETTLHRDGQRYHVTVERIEDE